MINNGWEPDDYAEITLEPYTESIVSYYHKDYGTNILDFHIDVFYINGSEKEVDILDAPTNTILFSKKNCEVYPTFELAKEISFNSTISEVKKICSPSNNSDSYVEYSGDENNVVKELRLDFDDEDVLKSVEFSLMKDL